MLEWLEEPHHSDIYRGTFGKCENAIFKLDFMYLWSRYSNFVTLKVTTVVSKGDEFIYDGLRLY